MGYSAYEYNSYGLLREEIPSIQKIEKCKNKKNLSNKENLSNEKCSTLKSAILDLNKGGYIDNNSVENSWNNTFKDTCGNW